MRGHGGNFATVCAPGGFPTQNGWVIFTSVVEKLTKSKGWGMDVAKWLLQDL